MVVKAKDRNVEKLQILKSMAPEGNRPKIDKIIDLYKSGIIPSAQIRTALNLVRALTSRRGKPENKFNKIVSKYEKHVKFNMSFILYTEPTYEKKKGQRKYKKLIQITPKMNLIGNTKNLQKDSKDRYDEIMRSYGNINNFLDAHKNKFLTVSPLSLGRDPTEEEEDNFYRLASVILTSKEIKAMHYAWGNQGDSNIPYVCGIYFYHAHNIKLLNIKPRNQLTARARCDQKQSIYNRYVSTTVLDITKDTLQEAINKYNNHIKNECWINTLYDFYKDSLLSPDKKRSVIIREIILQIIGKTEDNIKEGLTVMDMQPFFEKYRLQARVYDIFNKLIYKYDPLVRNHNNKILRCLLKDDHIYTLNHDVNRLDQIAEFYDETEFIVKASSNYRTQEDDETPNIYRMFETVDDILKIVKENQKHDEEEKEERKIIYLIHRYDDLVSILFELKTNVGYEPGICYESGRITKLFLEFNKITFIIKTQQLITSTVERPIVVENEDIYNRMNQAMVKLNKSMFRQSYKSNYTDLDIDILDEYRSYANVGLLRQKPTCNLVEIDVSKAYTSALIKIDKIPIFNEFDIFQPYNGEIIKD